ncbi:MAG: hypothetical protein IKN29_07555 [Bacteroidales bacterium]|nr:hypothetical protein [Bacteroidales bacterium]
MTCVAVSLQMLSASLRVTMTESASKLAWPWMTGEWSPRGSLSMYHVRA